MCDQLAFPHGMYREVYYGLRRWLLFILVKACFCTSATCPWLELVSPMIANLWVGSLGAVASPNSMTKPGVVFVISNRYFF